MRVRVERVAGDVRVCLNQNMESESLALEADLDSLGLDEVILSKIEEGVRLVESVAPVWLLDGRTFDSAVYWAGEGAGHVLLPADFMRLVSFKMSDWRRECNGAITTGDAEYALQRQGLRALRGSAERPVCVLTVHAGRMALEFYSCDDESAWIERALYVAEPRVDEQGGVEVSERCYRAAVNMTAALVLETLGDTGKAQTLRGVAMGLIGLGGKAPSTVGD